jgi:hypothetical protein
MIFQVNLGFLCFWVELHDYFLSENLSEVFTQIRIAFQDDISVLFFGEPNEYQDRINSSFHHFPLAQELIQFHTNLVQFRCLQFTFKLF